jgi:hypothetical protein
MKQGGLSVTWVNQSLDEPWMSRAQRTLVGFRGAPQAAIVADAQTAVRRHDQSSRSGDHRLGTLPNDGDD